MAQQDLSRPGTIWWTRTDPDALIPTWTVPGTMFHEGVPGHHLQLGTTTLNTTTLNRFQRLACELHPGHCEGWGLYAERLMDELGYFTDPAHRLGMLATGQLLRAARIVLDIGLHLRLPIPAGTGFHEGARWTPQLGRAFLVEHCGLGPAGFIDFEIDRYLGRPGQAVAYKLRRRCGWSRGTRPAAATVPNSTSSGSTSRPWIWGRWAWACCAPS